MLAGVALKKSRKILANYGSPREAGKLVDQAIQGLRTTATAQLAKGNLREAERLLCLCERIYMRFIGYLEVHERTVRQSIDETRAERRALKGLLTPGITG